MSGIYESLDSASRYDPQFSDVEEDFPTGRLCLGYPRRPRRPAGYETLANENEIIGNIAVTNNKTLQEITADDSMISIVVMSGGVAIASMLSPSDKLL